jgi:hypothetical protein
MRKTTRRIVGAALLMVPAAWISSGGFTARAAEPPKQNPHEKGATYYALEAKTGRLTTRFADGNETVADRDMSGAVHTVLSDRSGNRLANRLHPAPVTLDAASRSTAGRDDADVSEVVTEWSDGLTASLTRQSYPRRELAPGRFVQGRALVADLTLNGVAAGRGVWFVDEQVYAYSFPDGLGGAFIGPEHLNQHYGGWGFAPDTTWVNLQTIALYHFKAEIKAKGFLAKRCDAPQPNRVAQFFFPTVSANEPGCDGLHWIDGTILRACCDDHDRCYSANGCSSSSWWRFWSGWGCTYCNMEVVACFSNGGDPRCGIMRLAC